MSLLFSPYRLRELELPNRIFVSPMCQYSAEQGCATDWHLIHLGQLALSGAAMLCIEATAVLPEGRITAGDLGLYDDATEDALSYVLAAIRRYSPIAIAMQLSHAGRKSSSRAPWEGGAQVPLADGGWTTDAPSADPHKPGEDAPHALDAAGLARIRDAFVATARRADRLGIDALELHCAHGYLLHEFLSPLANHRIDAYGGSLENRMRFPLECFDAIREVFPAHKPIGVKISATDWVDAGPDRSWDVEQSIAFVQALKPRGLDWIDVSSGGVSPAQKIPVAPGYQVPFAHAIREATGVPTIAIGLITEPEHAERVLADGDADLVGLARAMLYDPRWPWHAAAALGGTVAAPHQYWRSQPSTHKGLFGPTTFGAR